MRDDGLSGVMHPNVLRLDKCSHTKASDPNVHMQHDVDASPSFIFMSFFFLFGFRLYMFQPSGRIFYYFKSPAELCCSERLR